MRAVFLILLLTRFAVKAAQVEEVTKVKSSQSARFTGTSPGDEVFFHTITNKKPIPVDRFLDTEDSKCSVHKPLYKISLKGEEDLFFRLILLKPDADPKDTAWVIRNYDGDLMHWTGLSVLPAFYLERRALLPFRAVLERFQFPEEPPVDPKTNQIITLLAQTILDHPEPSQMLPYFQVLLETQLKAIQSYEIFHLNHILLAGIKGLPFLEIFMKLAATEHTSSALAFLLSRDHFGAARSVEMYSKILEIPEFDPNAPISLAHCNFPASASEYFINSEEQFTLLSGLLFYGKFPFEYFKCICTCPRVNVHAPTGSCFMRTVRPDLVPFIRLDNRSLMFLAVFSPNFQVFLLLAKEMGFFEGAKELVSGATHFFAWIAFMNVYSILCYFAHYALKFQKI